MVPRAANLLLALISTSAATENLVRPLHGPYRLPSGPHGRRADFDTPLYPLGTGSTTRASSSAAATPQEVTIPDAISDSRPALTADTRQATGPTSLESHGNGEPPTTSVPANTRDTTLEPVAEITISQTSLVPTAIILHETIVLQTNGSQGAHLSNSSHGTSAGSSNLTQPGTTGLNLAEITTKRNSTQRASPADHVRPSAAPTQATNISMAGLNSSHAGSASSSLGLDLSAHIVSTRNQTANGGLPWHPPRPTACSGATLNIKNASLDYWYAETYTQVDSTFLIEFDENDTSTGWTLLPATTDILNITSAIENPACSSTALFDAELNQSGLEYACSETPTPAAKATSVVEQTAYTQPNATTSSGEIPDVVISPTPAALTVTNAGRESTYQAGTSVVHFSKFEIVDKSSYRHWNGSVGCVETTKVYDLPEQMSFEYDGETAVNESLAVGKLGRMSFALMQALDDSEVDLQSVELGDLEAEPTVVVVVEKVVVAAAALAQGVLAPAPSLETPTATLPPGLSFERTTPTQPGTTWVPFTAHVESSADALDLPTKTSKKPSNPQQPSPSPPGVAIAEGGSTGTGADQGNENEGRGSAAFPFVAHIENSAVTLAIPVDPTNPPSVVTAQFGGRVVTATRLIGAGPLSGDLSIGRVVSAIDQIARPTNALEVLNNAQATFSAGGAASAIAAGIGFSDPTNSGSSSNVEKDLVRGLNQNPDLIIGNSVFTATRSGSGLVVDGQTLVAGGSSITVAGQAVSLSSDGLTVSIGGRVIAISRGSDAESGLTLSIGSSAVEATRVADGLAIGGQTLSPGGPAVFVNGKELSLGPDGTELSVGGSDVQIGDIGNVGAVANIPVIQLGTRRFTANAATQYNLDGTTLVPGDQVVVAGTTVSLGPSATRLLINGEAQLLTPPAITPGPLLTLGDRVYKPNLGSTYDIDSRLLTPGGQLVVSGTTLSLPVSGRSIIVNGIARSLGLGGTADDSLATITAPPVLVLNGRAVSPNGGTSYIIYGQTLTPGGSITYEEGSQQRTLSLNSAANALVTIVDGQSYTSRVGMVGAAPAGAPVLTIDGNTYSAVEYNAGSGATYVVDGTTLIPGGVITIAGPDGEETISLLPAGTAIFLEANGLTTRSEIEDAYGVRPTNAPILTIGGEEFTAVNNDATYFVDGQTISPGHVETVTIGRRTFIVSLSPHATRLEIVELASDGEAIATEFETLFPATVAAPTITSTAEGATRSGSSTLNPGSEDGSSADDESIALLSFSTTFAGALLALSSLALAIWL